MEGLLNTFALLAIALLNAVAAFFAYRASVTTKETNAVARATAKDVGTVIEHTNSMKDALVASTGSAAHLAGREEARVEAVELTNRAAAAELATTAARAAGREEARIEAVVKAAVPVPAKVAGVGAVVVEEQHLKVSGAPNGKK